MDWYQTTSVSALLLAAAALWELRKLRTLVHADELRRSRKFLNAIEGDHRVAQHRADSVPDNADSKSRQFFTDFGRLADHINRINADGPWCLENTGKIVGPNPEDGGNRRIDIWYNQWRTGYIKISCIDYGAEGIAGDVWLEIHIRNARDFGAYEVMGLCVSLLQLVVDPADFRKAEADLQAAMLAALWKKGEDIDVNPQLEFRIGGPAKWFREKVRNELGYGH